MKNLAVRLRATAQGMSGRRGFSTLARAGLTLACFAALYAVSDLGEAVRLAAGANPALIAAAIVLLIARVPLMASRWRIILEDAGVPVKGVRLTRILYVSTFFGIALPSANGNDLVRGIMLKAAKTPLSAVIASIAVDRLYGIYTMVLLVIPGALALAAAHGRSPLLDSVILCAGGLLALGTLALAAPSLFPTLVRAGRALAARIGAAAFLEAGIATLSRPSSMLRCVLLSLLAQLIDIVGVVLVAAAANIDQPIWTYFAFVPIVWIVTTLPIAISGLGLREASFAFLFGAIGASSEQGIAVGLLTSVTALLAAACGGLALLPRWTAHPASQQAENNR